MAPARAEICCAGRSKQNVPAEVIAVDALTGADKWRISIHGPLGEGIDTALLIYDNTIYVSTIPGNVAGYYQGGQRGVIHALDINTGNLWDTKSC